MMVKVTDLLFKLTLGLAVSLLRSFGFLMNEEMRCDEVLVSGISESGEGTGVWWVYKSRGT